MIVHVWEWNLGEKSEVKILPLFTCDSLGNKLEPIM